jgi:hypothetical protein
MTTVEQEPTMGEISTKYAEFKGKVRTYREAAAHVKEWAEFFQQREKEERKKNEERWERRIKGMRGTPEELEPQKQEIYKELHKQQEYFDLHKKDLAERRKKSRTAFKAVREAAQELDELIDEKAKKKGLWNQVKMVKYNKIRKKLQEFLKKKVVVKDLSNLFKHPDLDNLKHLTNEESDSRRDLKVKLINISSNLESLQKFIKQHEDWFKPGVDGETQSKQDELIGRLQGELNKLFALCQDEGGVLIAEITLDNFGKKLLYAKNLEHAELLECLNECTEKIKELSTR